MILLMAQIPYPVAIAAFIVVLDQTQSYVRTDTTVLQTLQNQSIVPLDMYVLKALANQPYAHVAISAPAARM